MDSKKKTFLHKGTVIPAHPLALTNDKQIDEVHQRALTNYYMASGAGGIAIGVHSTQFEIREPQFDLYEPVLEMAADEIQKAHLQRTFLKIAGVCGKTDQAVKEAEIAKQYGYDMVLLSMGGLDDYSEDELLERTKAITKILPVFGFYLQPAVGGRILSFDFWKNFSNIEGVYAIKMAPFNRYHTLDVVRAVCSSNRNNEVALYTGNDDNIIVDLMTTYRFNINGKMVEKDIVGGLLGHWAVWTKKAVELFNAIQSQKKNESVSSDWLTTNIQVTDANAVLFDVKNDFKGCISGIHEVLRRQGLMENILCLSDHEQLSLGQSEEIDRIYKDYPHLNDDAFVKENLQKWIK